MAQQLFRNEVIEAGRTRLIGRVVAATPPGAWLYTGLALAAFAIALLIAMLGSFSTTADVRGVVAYDQGVARVYPRTTAEVARIFVKAGQQVAAGDPLVELAIAQGQQGLAPQLKDLSRQDAELARQSELAGIETVSQLAALTQRAAGIDAAIASLQRQLVLAREQVGLAESAARRAQALAREQAATQRQVEDARSAVLARRAEAEAIAEQIAAQRSARQAAAAERALLTTGGAKSASLIEGQRAALAAELKALERSDRIVLVAPVAGTVGDLTGELGQQVRPDAAVATIVPAGSKLEIWLFAPSRAVGHARVGQQVRLQFDAFPHRTYGTGLGVVSAVAGVPTEPAALDPGLKIAEPVFRIRTSLRAMAPRVTGGPQLLRPGMTVTGKIVVERRSLWAALFGWGEKGPA